MTDCLQIVTTAGSRDEAQRIALALVEARLVACAQVHGPIQSTYWWQGKIESSEEWYCVAKTVVSRYEAVEELICKTHSYDVPEILAFRAERGSAEYLKWLEDEVAPAD